MLSAIRTAAIASVARPTATRLSMAAASRRLYATDQADQNGNKEDQQQQKQEENKDAGAGAAAASPEDAAAKALAEKDKKISELQDAYIRCLADQENLRERTRKEITSAQEFAIQKFAKDLLDTVDILGMALQSVPENLRTKDKATEAALEAEKLVDQLTNLYTGVSMTETELIKTLKRHGVEQQNPEGEAFDPNQHQALFQAPMPGKEAGTVFAVQKMGYTLKGRVLRPAQVGVVAEQQ